ncbi:MAG TPA: NAD(P)H-binding protein [Terriglobales bacterium]|nr:NAD(P)H-binding protein [Terriglobales bacterium]
MYAIIGATGNTGRVIVSALLAQNEEVRVIGRNEERLQPLVQRGAEPFVADATDGAALARAFTGVRGAYVMIPPNATVPSYAAYVQRVVEAIGTALEEAGVPYVVALSSMGADKESGTGPVVGLHHLEERINRIPGTHALHLRPGYFMENFLEQVPVIRQFGIVGDSLRPDLGLPMIATRDIGSIASEHLLKLDFSGKQIRELHGQRDVTMMEAARIIGKAVGKPDLAYAQLPAEQIRAALIQMGLSAELSDLLIEMSSALNSGHMRALDTRSAANTTPTSFEQFVEEVFVPAFQGESRAA